MQQTKLPRPFPNVTPVSNRYLAEKEFAKEKEDYKNHVRFVSLFFLLQLIHSLEQIKNARGLIDQSSPTPRPHCQERVRQKHVD